MRNLALTVAGCLFALTAHAANSGDTPESKDQLAGLTWRNVGPALVSGRIADVARHPNDDSTWYVAVGSGGVWKTLNAGVSWEPIFDKQTAYSIGTVSLDPSNPNTVWVGTGENVGGRHVGFGDGVYRSTNGGKNWENLGLKDSQHIAKILIHPSDSNTVWVAAEGPLWTKGGERGLYLSTDGGQTWTRTLGDDEWTGVTDVVIDPRDPNRLYAATWQRHRTVAAYMGGGPKSGIHLSEDGGRTWRELSNGLPKGNRGKIGLAISPQNPDVLYAAIELDQRKGGVWRTDNRGASWTKGADAVGGGTGPHYYQELFVSPHEFDRLYLVGPRVQTSSDGGKTFSTMRTPYMHSDIHDITFHPTDPDYLMMGSDGGLYESFDKGEHWRLTGNLPLTQFYKLALDDSEPFYNIYGGTQDNGTLGGPSRTASLNGIRNADWFKILGADGHQPATEPGNPAVVYGEWQQGRLHRVDTVTGETVFIQPQPKPGEPAERFNWDAPILVSAHDPKRIYFASQRVWRSDSRGDAWTPISGDLTRNQDRMQLPLMDRQWSWEAPWDLFAMSAYNTITSLAESPLDEALLYAGTDDGLIHVSENGGESWRKINVGDLPGVPDTAFINDIRADLHDADTVYIALDNHKYGDFTPQLLVSRDRGRKWKRITNGLPDRHLVWRLVQDHVAPNLLFVGTEFGVYVSFNAGGDWQKLGGGMPTIPVRDIQIQRRENDLVAASFGRGFFILDDFSALRDFSPADSKAEATLFTPRAADWFYPRPSVDFTLKGSQGDALYVADNPEFGAILTYHLANDYPTQAKQRQERDKALIKAGKDTPFPGWDVVERERRETAAQLQLIIRNAAGDVIRRIDAPAKKGFNRVAWDLRHAPYQAINTPPNWQGIPPRGLMVAPGDYSAELVLIHNGEVRSLAEPVTVAVERAFEAGIEGGSLAEHSRFTEEYSALARKISATNNTLKEVTASVEALQKAVAVAPTAPGELESSLHTLRQELYALEEALDGNESRDGIDSYQQHTVGNWSWHASGGISNSSYGPTPAHWDSLRYATEALAPISARINDVLTDDLPALRAAVQAAGAPWGTGQAIPNA